MKLRVMPYAKCFSFLQIGLGNRQLFIIVFKQYLSKALNTMQPVREILVLIARASSHSLNAHAQLLSETTCFIFGPIHPRLPLFEYASSECSDESAHMRRLV